jgi:tRNA(Arg) A34 adenosine deaminase TadA
MSKKKIRLCEMALEVAHKSDIKIKHGAIIAKGSKPIMFGFNHNRSLVGGKFCCSYHAEMHVIMLWLKKCGKHDKKKISRKAKKLNLYIARRNKDITNNMFSSSKPCSMCIKLLLRCNFKNIIFTTGKENIYEVVKLSNLKHHSLTKSDRLYLKHIDSHKHISNLIK